MSPSAFPAGPDQGSVADALARALLDPSVCPSCGTSLTSPRCPRCGVDLSGEAGRRVWSLGHRAVLVLREREQLLTGLRADAARTAEHASIAAAARERAGAALDRRGAPPRPPLTPQIATGGRARGPAVQSLLVGLGALLLAVAAVVFLAVAWDLLGLAGRAAVVAVLTAGALGAAAFLRPRLPETAEALAALGAVLVLGDAWAARATGLAGADRVPGLLYAAVVAALAAALLGALGIAARLRAATVTAALLAPAAPALAGLHAGTPDRPEPIVAGLLVAAVVAAGRGLLPARLPAEAAVLRSAALAATALAVVVVALTAPSAAAAWEALAAVPVLALQAVSDGPRTRGGGVRASAWPSLWSSAAGVALVSAAVLAVLTALDGTSGRWVLASAAAVTSAVAAALVAGAVRLASGTTPGRRLAGLGLDPGAALVGAGVAVAASALPVAGGALEVLGALAQAASRPWQALPGERLGDLLTPIPGDRLALVAGLAVPGLLAAALPLPAGRVGGVRRAGEVAVGVSVVLLGTLPGLAVATGAALLAAVAVAGGVLWGRVGRPLVLVVTVASAAAAVLVAWTAQVTSGPVTALGVLGLLAARQLVARPDVRAALAAGGVVTAAISVTAVAAPVVGASGAWADLSPAAIARLLALLAASGAGAGLAALVPLTGTVPLAERRAAAVAAAAVGVLALPGPLTSGQYLPATVVLAALLLLAVAAALGGEVARPVGTPAAGAAPVLAAAVAASAVAAAGSPLRVLALAVVLVAVATAVALVALALRVTSWADDPRRPAVELGAAFAGAAGLVVAAGGPQAWLPFALAGAGLAAVAVTPGRGRLADVSVVPFAIASGLLLDAAGVRTPEAYTLPPALALLALGGRRLATGAVDRSWPALGPGLVLALAPSVLVAADRGPVVRVVVLTLAAGGVVLAGVRGRWGAPVVVGSLALAAHATAQLGPALVDLGASVPRWTVLATVGALLLLEGATYERQVTRLRAAAVRLASLR